MATITLTHTVKVKDGSFVFNRRSSFSVTQSGAGGGNPGKVSLTTSETTVSFGSVSTPGVVRITNIGDTNAINYGFSTGNLNGEIGPGESYVIKLKSGASLILESAASTTDAVVEALEA